MAISIQVSNQTTLIYNSSVNSEQIIVEDTTVYPLQNGYYFAGYWNYKVKITTPTGNIIKAEYLNYYNSGIASPFSNVYNVSEGGLYEIEFTAVPSIQVQSLYIMQLGFCFHFMDNLYKCVVNNASFVPATERFNIQNGLPLSSSFVPIEDNEITSNFRGVSYQIYTEPIKKKIFKFINCLACKFKIYTCDPKQFCKDELFLNMYKLISCYYSLNDIVTSVTSVNLEKVKNISNLANQIMQNKRF